MGKSKKIVLFIVEGITDETSLALILSKIIEKDRIVKFKVINGDITSENGTNLANIPDKIANKIKDFIEKDIYTKSDIFDVIHLVDTDGVYIADNLIIQKDIEKVEYDAQKIYARNVEDIKKRNEQKSQILDKLIETSRVCKNLNYRIYFFSSNLEHVLHNKQNVLKGEKNNYAHIFEDKFVDEPNSFIEFITNKEFALNGEYEDTWDFIKKDTNSLKRYTNFNLYLKSITTE